MIERPRPFVVASIAVLTTIGLGGCADDGNDSAVGGWSSFPTAPAAPPDGAPPAVEPTAPADGAPTDVEPTGVVVPVIALDNSFRPAIVEISVGDEVRWENRGLNEHNVLYVEGADWGVEVEGFQPGDVYSHVFTVPGEYRYFCSIHGSTEVGMVGTVVVG